MNGKNKADGLRQQTLTSFWLNVPKKSENNGSNRKKRQREETEEISPKKLALNTEKRNLLQKSPEKKGIKRKICDEKTQENGFGDIFFEDFENDPFLSPKKEKSPRKTVLTENFSEGKDNRQLETNELNFETAVRCLLVKLTKFTKERSEMELLLKEENSGKKGICFVRDAWISSPFVVGQLLSIQAVDTKHGWVVDNKNGFVVLHPDIIISSTSLVASMFCMRQGLLQNFFKEISSGSNDIMFIGRLVHELFQKCLKIKLSSDQDFLKVIDEILQSRDYLKDFLFSSLELSEIKKKMVEFIPHIKQFLEVYVHRKVAPSGNNFSGSVESIVDIEELITSPNLGLQGRIDVTVKMKSGFSEHIAPLELKTGRAVFSSEHKSQLALYILLMNNLGRKVESGLLLYLKEDIMEEIKPQRDEIRNLFLLRNHLIGFYKSIKNYELPDPIRSIKCCSKCSYVRVCKSYLKAEEEGKYSESLPLKSLEFPDIKDSHIDYFVEWNKMLWLEYGEAFDKKDEASEISGLKLDFDKSKEDFRYNFRRTARSGRKEIGSGTFVYVLNDKSERIGCGRILSETDSVVSVLTDKKLENVFSESYKLVAFKFKILNSYLNNLGWLLDEKCEKLREIIIEKKLPNFQMKLERKNFKEKCLKALVGLNKEQKKAVLKSVFSDDYCLIKGPPGTGKTQTIVVLVKVLVALGQKVLLSGHTHSSVDNILLRLDNIEYLRLGVSKSIHKNIHSNCYEHLIQKCKTVDDVRRLFERKVIASTCLGLDAAMVGNLSFDVCIVDESSQVLQPEILRPLFCAKKFILVGDEDQLPPIVRNSEARKLGMAKSMFERLISPSSIVPLKYQYRMNSTINSLANRIAYDGAIECGDEKVAKKTLQITNKENYLLSEEWVMKILSNDLDKSVVFVDTSGYFRWTNAVKKSEPRCSILECNIILKLLYCLKNMGIKEESVGVIAPFCDQIELLRKNLTRENLNKIELNTVDQYQGRDKDVILFSCSKENLEGSEVSDLELLNDMRRLTVSVTRAKHKLILIGDKQSVVRYQPFQKLIKNLTESQFVVLTNGEKNFYWKYYDR